MDFCTSKWECKDEEAGNALTVLAPPTPNIRLIFRGAFYFVDNRVQLGSLDAHHRRKWNLPSVE